MTTDATAEHPVLAAVRDMAKAIDVVRQQLPFLTDAQALGDTVLELVEVTAQLDGLRAQTIGQAAANGVPQCAGVRTMGQFVGSQTNRSPAPSRRDQTLHKWIRDYPTFADAYYTGQITVEHVHILKKLENERSIGLLRGAQGLLVDAAVEVETFEAFKTVCEYWLITVDPDGAEPIDQLEENAVRFRRGSGGRGKIVMDLDAINFAAAKKMIDHRGDHLQATNDVAPGQDRPTASHDRFAGTMSLLTAGFARADGTMPVPLINIVMSEQVAEWALGQLAGDPASDAVPVHPFDVDGRCELIDGTPVHPLLVLATTGLWGVSPAVLRRYVLSAKGRILDYSYNARIHPEHLRTAAHIEHRGRCATKGCDAPHSWLQMDHKVPASKGGPTSLPNTDPMCQPDNLAKGDGPGFGPALPPRQPQRPVKRPPSSRSSSRADDDPDGDQPLP